MESVQKVCKFLQDCGVFYFATVEGDQPRVRPFGIAHLFEGKIYVLTGKAKNVSAQLAVNPKVEICGFHEGTWLRVACTMVTDDRLEAKQSLLDTYPNMKATYSAEDENTHVLYMKDATATFSSFTAAPETVTF